MRVLIIAGSHRTEAYSTALAQAVADKLTEQGHEPDLAEIVKLDLPMHNPADHRDPEGSQSPQVREFAARTRKADALVWITPIYHGSYTSRFKNALDNINISLMKGKPVALMCHGGGRFGGSVLDHMRTMVVSLHGRLLSTAVATNTDDYSQTDEGPQLSSQLIFERLDRVMQDLATY